MPEGDGGDAGDSENRPGRTPGHPRSHSPVFDRATICVSSQVGCAVNCQFCMTALLGIKRNLSAGEIVGQVLCVLNDRAIAVSRERVNLVFMGMGEPFLNYENFMKAVRLLVEGASLPESRMTVSTAGIVPRIRELGQEAVRPKLAISLNASNDEQRNQLMPINRKVEFGGVNRGCAPIPITAARTPYLRVCAAGGRERSPRKRARSCRTATRTPLQSELDRAESGAGDCVRRTLREKCAQFPGDSGRVGRASLCAPSARARYLCRLRPIEKSYAVGSSRLGLNRFPSPVSCFPVSCFPISQLYLLRCWDAASALFFSSTRFLDGRQ